MYEVRSGLYIIKLGSFWLEVTLSLQMRAYLPRYAHNTQTCLPLIGVYLRTYLVVSMYR